MATLPPGLPPQRLVGGRVKKHFSDGWYHGTVTSYDAKVKW
jgi:hypothetical protein